MMSNLIIQELQIEQDSSNNCKYQAGRGLLVISRRRFSTHQGEAKNDSAGMLRWLLTYSDLITLLLAFFVIMYAISTANQQKFAKLRASLQMAMGDGSKGSNIILEYSGDKPIEVTEENREKENQDYQEVINNIKAGTDNPDNMAFKIDERGLTISFMDNLLFDLGKAELRPDSLPLLAAVGNALRSNPSFVRVEGHADNLPIHNAQFASNWELSAARSIAVTRYLIENHGMEPKRLSSLGYGEFRPLYPNDTAENRSKNRRVDIVLLRTEHAGADVWDSNGVNSGNDGNIVRPNMNVQQ